MMELDRDTYRVREGIYEQLKIMNLFKLFHYNLITYEELKKELDKYYTYNFDGDDTDGQGVNKTSPEEI